jgi:hypothetical protein
MRLIHLAFCFSLFLTLLSSCSDQKETTSLNSKFTAYTKENKQVVFSGKIDVEAILENADYSHIPKLNALIGNELMEFKKGIILDSGVYFTTEGLLTTDGEPEILNLFAFVKNQDSLRDKIASLGMMVEQTNNLDFAIGNKYSIGFQNDIVVFHFQKNGVPSSKELKSIFQPFAKKSTEINPLYTTSQKALIVETHLDHLYALYAKQENILLNEQQQKEINSLLEHARLQSSLSFSDGGISIATKHLFSEALKKRMIFKEDKAASSLSSFAKGNASAGFTMHMDPLKIQTFIEDFYPTFFQQLGEWNSSISFGLFALGNRPITNLLGGKLGIIHYATDSQSGYLELGEQGKNLSGLAKSFLPNNTAFRFNISPSQISATSSNHQASKQLILPTYAKGFGQHGIDLFIDIQDLLKQSPSLGEENAYLAVISYMTFRMDNNGSSLRIQGKDTKKGILKQVVDKYIGLITESMKGY